MAMVNKDNYEEYMMMYADGELNEAETTALLQYVDAHPALRKELEAYAAAKLVPDTTIVYADKEQLLKTAPAKGRTVGMQRWWMYAAAAAVLLFAVTLIRQSNTTDSPVVADVSSKQKVESRKSVAKIQSPKSKVQSPESKVQIPIAKSQSQKARVQIPKPKYQSPNTKTQNPNTNNEYVPTETVIAKEKETVPVVQQPAYEPVKEEAVVAQHTEQATTIEANTSAPEETIYNEPQKQKRRLLDMLPISKQKKEGAGMIANAITKRIESVTGNLKDTDVKLKIGNKEIFIVKL
ncbi:hypothetical protein CAP35_03400 [Chitinophagaceae bacterium IBVUCB1]|nr:hypothetical protein CAP35_03400 [Chitinophagaceae bacterium IBVUCB1]